MSPNMDMPMWRPCADSYDEAQAREYADYTKRHNPTSQVRLFNAAGVMLYEPPVGLLPAETP